MTARATRSISAALLVLLAACAPPMQGGGPAAVGDPATEAPSNGPA